MILIADSGSTKCSWAMCDQQGNILKDILTIGFNPYFIDHQNIIIQLTESELNLHRKEITTVFFYGAGCSSKEKNKIIQEPLKEFFTNAEITVKHDLDAACFAMYNGNPNITCILGTGSNSCFYDGKEIVEHAPSLGFIMGDEASGNYFGKRILNLYFNKLLPKNLKKEFENSFDTNITTINNNIYNNNRANVFLAKYFPFIIETKHHPLIQKLIKETLDEFINIHVKCFNNYNNFEINFIGSVAHFLCKEIQEAIKRNNLKEGRILQNPIKKLIEFHVQNPNKR